MPDPKKTIDKVLEYLRYQNELYGPLSDSYIQASLDVETRSAERDEEIHTEERYDVPKKGNKKHETDMVNEPSSETDIYAQIENAADLEELRKICENASFLKTDLENTRLVFGVGNPDADLMLVGEAPGYHEDKQGEPFVGRAGQLLNKILEAIHFKREEVYIANILKHRPPDNRDPQSNERERSLPVLLKQIDLIKPKLVLCLGRISAQTLLGNTEPMYAMRRKFHPFGNNIELMVTYHPAALLRNPKWKRDTWDDVQMLRKRYDELGGKP